MSIIVKNISKLYDKKPALNNVSFEVKDGEIVGFIGPNGAGKSTMMKIITCYLPQTSGKVTVCGFDVEEQSFQVREQVGYLPEHNPLYLDMYVKEYLQFVGGLHKVKNINKRVAEMIDMTGLQVEQNKKIGALSKGYRQRVGIAQAIIHNPKVLILDEPTTGLDPNQLEDIRKLIKNLGREKTVMLSTHIMQEVEAVCDRVIIISQGEIRVNDETTEIKKVASEKSILTVEFESAINESYLKALDGVERIKKLSDTKYQITSEASVDLRKAIFDFAVKHNNSVLGMQKEERKLEDVFKDNTKRK